MEIKILAMMNLWMNSLMISLTSITNHKFTNITKNHSIIPSRYFMKSSLQSTIMLPAWTTNIRKLYLLSWCHQTYLGTFTFNQCNHYSLSVNYDGFWIQSSSGGERERGKKWLLSCMSFPSKVPNNNFHNQNLFAVFWSFFKTNMECHDDHSTDPYNARI